MDVEGKLNDCEYYLRQINHFDPDPFYINYFLEGYIQSVIGFYDEIFKEANLDFGLFAYSSCTKEKFQSKAKEKNENLALKFLSWFEGNYEKEHQSPYPRFISKIIRYYRENKLLPKISIKISSTDSYKDDISQEIKVRLSLGKLNSREELQVEIRRQLPGFLEIINQKRKNQNEPKVVENQVKASTFLEIDNRHVEISQVCGIYIPVMKRILNESRNELRRLTCWSS